jgi:hypothetical protein
MIFNVTTKDCYQNCSILQQILAANNELVSTKQRLEALNHHRYIVSGWLSLLVASLGIIGNSLTIFVLSKPTMISITNTFITALSFSDLISLVLVTYLVPLRNLLIEHASLNHAYTYLYPVIYPLAATFQFTSIYLMLVTCLSRAVSLYSPVRLCLSSMRKCWLIISLIFATSGIACSPLWFFYKTDYVRQPDSSAAKITLSFSLSADTRSFVHAYIIVLTNLVPLAALAVVNYYLVTFLYKARKRRHRLGVRERNELTITFILIVFFCLFFFCQLPNFLLHVLQAVHLQIDTVLHLYFRQWANFLLILSSSYSFVIYCSLSCEFREEARKMLTCNRTHSYLDLYNTYTTTTGRRNCVARSAVVRFDYRDGQGAVRLNA